MPLYAYTHVAGECNKTSLSPKVGEGVRKLAPYLFMYHCIRKLKIF